MNEKKICPLLSVSPGDMNVSCPGDRCAWWVPPLGSKGEGRCAIQLLGMAAPELIRAVHEI